MYVCVCVYICVIHVMYLYVCIHIYIYMRTCISVSSFFTGGAWSGCRLMSRAPVLLKCDVCMYVCVNIYV